MTEGTVKFFNGMRNFGFITGEDGKEYFVHGSGVKEGTALKEGDKVIVRRSKKHLLRIQLLRGGPMIASPAQTVRWPLDRHTPAYFSSVR